MKKKCPVCKSIDGVREYLYGMPSEEPDPAKYVIGGCCPSDEVPEFKCLNCDIDFGEVQALNGNRFITDSLEGLSITCDVCSNVFLATDFESHACK